MDKSKNSRRLGQTKFSFGATSAIITNLALITGLDTMANAKLSIIGGILAIALADNIADSTGIHVFQESECIDKREVWFSTFTNFSARLLVSLTFVFLIVVLPIKVAVFCSIIWGLALLTFLTYTISKGRQANPYSAILEHIIIAGFVIVASHFVGKWVIGKFS